MARSNTSIYAALAANIAIAVAKFFAASVSKSASMAAEAIHSLVDCFNELLLFLVSGEAIKRETNSILSVMAVSYISGHSSLQF